MLSNTYTENELHSTVIMKDQIIYKKCKSGNIWMIILPF